MGMITKRTTMMKMSKITILWQETRESETSEKGRESNTEIFEFIKFVHLPKRKQ